MAKRILLPVDLSHETSAAAAASVANDLVKGSGASVHVMTVVPAVNPIVDPYLPSDLQAKTEAHARAGLKEFASRNLAVPAELTVHVGMDSVYHAIIEEAEALNIDLIVMASHRPELGDYLLGSNAAKVVRHANCSVYIVRE